jgi:hypothetical protein
VSKGVVALFVLAVAAGPCPVVAADDEPAVRSGRTLTSNRWSGCYGGLDTTSSAPSTIASPMRNQYVNVYFLDLKRRKENVAVSPADMLNVFFVAPTYYASFFVI